MFSDLVCGGPCGSWLGGAGLTGEHRHGHGLGSNIIKLSNIYSIAIGSKKVHFIIKIVHQNAVAMYSKIALYNILFMGC